MSEPLSSTSPQSGSPVGMFKRLTSLLSDSATYGVSSLAGQIAQFLLLPIYTFYLSPTDLGIIAMLLIVIMIFGPLANLGMTNAIFRRFHQGADEAARKTLMGTGLLSVVCGSLAWFAATLLFAPWIAREFVGAAESLPWVRLALLAAAIQTIGQVPRVALRAKRKIRLAAGMNFVVLLVSIVTTLVLVAGLGLGVLGWVLGQIAGEAVSLALGMFAARREFALRFEPAMWRSMLSYGLPIVPHRLQAIVLAQFSQFMVRKQLGLDEAGIYAVAAKFALPVGLVVNAVQESWVPFKFQLHAQEADARPAFRSMFTYYFAGMSYLWVGVSIWGFAVVPLMTTVEFHSAAYLVPVLALLRFSQGVYFMMGTGIELSERTAALPLISLAGLVTIVIAAFLLIDPLGAFGAALAGVLCWLTMGVVNYHLAQRRYHINYDWPTISALAVLAAVSVAAAYAVQEWNLGLRLSAMVALSLAYPTVALAILLRSPSERDRVSRVIEKVRKPHRPAVTAAPQDQATFV